MIVLCWLYLKVVSYHIQRCLRFVAAADGRLAARDISRSRIFATRNPPRVGGTHLWEALSGGAGYAVLSSQFRRLSSATLVRGVGQ